MFQRHFCSFSILILLILCCYKDRMHIILFIRFIFVYFIPNLYDMCFTSYAIPKMFKYCFVSYQFYSSFLIILKFWYYFFIVSVCVYLNCAFCFNIFFKSMRFWRLSLHIYQHPYLLEWQRLQNLDRTKKNYYNYCE